MIANKDLPVKDSSITIQRGKHNKENPYVMISKKMLKDKEISPRTKGILCYLLSLPDTWQVHPRQVADALDVGKDQIYSAMNELLKTGYALKKESKCEKGRFGSTLYEFFEEKLPEDQRFKEKITVSGNPDTVFPDTENPPIENIDIQNTDSIENRCRTSSSKVPAEAGAADAAGEVSNPQKVKRSKMAQEFSPEVKDLAEKMIAIAMRCNTVYRPPDNLEKFYSQVQMMLEKDKQDPVILLRTFEWACSDSESRDSFKGWQSVVCTNKRKGKVSNPAEIFRGHYSTIYSQMNSQPKRKFAPSSNDARSLAKLEEWSKSAL